MTAAEQARAEVEGAYVALLRTKDWSNETIAWFISTMAPTLDAIAAAVTPAFEQAQAHQLPRVGGQGTEAEHDCETMALAQLADENIALRERAQVSDGVRALAHSAHALRERAEAATLHARQIEIGCHAERDEWRERTERAEALQIKAEVQGQKETALALMRAERAEAAAADAWNQARMDWRLKCEQARTDVARLREALLRYVQHDDLALVCGMLSKEEEALCRAGREALAATEPKL